MLTKSLAWKNRVCSVCERSGDLLSGAAFSGVRLADREALCPVPAGAVVVCCGKTSEEELLFRTEDGRSYFSLRDGWGEEDGVLYGLRLGFSFDFMYPTTADNILAACDTALGDYHTWGGAMLHASEKRALAAICRVMAPSEA